MQETISMKEILRQVLRKAHVEAIARELYHNTRRGFGRIRREFGRVDKTITQKYLNEHDIRKLHIGCGNHVLDSWLNSDFYPDIANILHLDATKPFPLEDEDFDYVFSEHMIEHVPYSDGLFMLKECCRILKKNGKIRISTVVFWPARDECSSRHDRLLLGEQIAKDIFHPLPKLEVLVRI